MKSLAELQALRDQMKANVGIREDENETIHIALNRASFPIHFDFGESWTDLMQNEDGSGAAVLEPCGFRIIKVTKKGQ